MSTAISIMAKAPEAGRVKTRLCPPLLPEQAAELAAALLLDTWRAAEELERADERASEPAGACASSSARTSADGVEVLLVYAGDRTRFPEPVRGLRAFVQRGADLGARIEHAARLGLARAERVIVIGSDLPGLPAARLVEARAALATHDAVLGPSSDGGFYLIGLRRCPPGLLSGLAWSVPETRAACAARLVQRGLRLAHVADFDDVDDIEDLRRVERQIRSGEIAAPATAHALERLACTSA
jgi:rSAM/selenodomain-associated transferase 1